MRWFLSAGKRLLRYCCCFFSLVCFFFRCVDLLSFFSIFHAPKMTLIKLETFLPISHFSSFVLNFPVGWLPVVNFFTIIIRVLPYLIHTNPFFSLYIFFFLRVLSCLFTIQFIQKQFHIYDD